jgi:hypothetical protein
MWAQWTQTLKELIAEWSATISADFQIELEAQQGDPRGLVEEHGHAIGEYVRQQVLATNAEAKYLKYLTAFTLVQQDILNPRDWYPTPPEETEVEDAQDPPITTTTAPGLPPPTTTSGVPPTTPQLPSPTHPKRAPPHTDTGSLLKALKKTQASLSCALKGRKRSKRNQPLSFLLIFVLILLQRRENTLPPQIQKTHRQT